MDSPVIVQIVGLPGTGKTLVARMAKRAFMPQGLKTAWLDVDQFARCYQSMAHNLDQAESRHTPRFIQDVFTTFKTKLYELKRRFTPNDELARDPFVMNAAKHWVIAQQADIIFLEHHWLANLRHYPRHELWLVTAPPELCLHRLARRHGPTNGSMVQAGMIAGNGLKHWGIYNEVLFTERTLITNNHFGRNAIRKRLFNLADEIGWRHASGKYAPEDDRPTLPPTKI